jgi:hypothetical protein
MNVCEILLNMGLTLELTEDGKLALEGLNRLNLEEREFALNLAKKNKVDILKELRRSSAPKDAPDPAAVAHARRMQLLCPSLGKEVHLWTCSRCSGTEPGGCTAWLPRRAEVEFFRRSDAPLSFFLVDALEPGDRLQ